MNRNGISAFSLAGKKLAALAIVGLLIFAVASGAEAKVGYKFTSKPFILDRGDGDTIGAKSFTPSGGDTGEGIAASSMELDSMKEKSLEQERSIRGERIYHWLILYLVIR